MEVFDAPSRYYPSNALTLDELAYWIALNRIAGIGTARFKGLLDFFHEDMAAAWTADSKALAHAGLDQKTIDSLIKQRNTSSPQQELERLEKMRVRVITWKDKEYPPLLKEIHSAPPILYVAGTFTEADQVALAVVGTRKLSAYGRQVTEKFVSELAENNITIVSGLAQGIDTVAHTAALEAGGRTVAILAGGLDHIYPSHNLALARRMVESGQGALITEYALGVTPDSKHFPVRNRIISGLSQGVLVTEAPLRSGALITTEFALEQGRDVFAVPGNIFSAGCEGTNKLIQMGAHAVLNINDILEVLNLSQVAQHIEVQTAFAEEETENDDERKLLELLSHEPLHVDDLIREAGLPTMTVTAALMMMELKGKVKQVGGMQYILAR